jgi:hypothetical protein
MVPVLLIENPFRITRSPVIVSWLATFVSWMLLQVPPTVRVPVNTGQFGAADGMVTSTKISGTRWLSQFVGSFQSEEVAPVHNPAIPTWMYEVFVMVFGQVAEFTVRDTV